MDLARIRRRWELFTFGTGISQKLYKRALMCTSICAGSRTFDKILPRYHGPRNLATSHLMSSSDGCFLRLYHIFWTFSFL